MDPSNPPAAVASAPFRKIPLGPCDVSMTTGADGSLLIRSNHPLQPYGKCLTDHVLEGAQQHPERVFLAVRDAGKWKTLTWAQARHGMLRIAQALLQRELSPQQPVAILSGSGIEHALIILATLHVGIPHCSITPAYSLLSTDHAKLASLLGLLTPGLVFADDGAAFDGPIAKTLPTEVEVVTSCSALMSRPSTPFAELLATEPTQVVNQHHDSVGPDTVAKILFTSGSTGMPKGVINTQRMLCSNQQMFVQAVPAIVAQPPVIVSWLPWHHTSGGNQMLGLTIYCGGSLYVDDGKPLPTEVARTARNLAEIAPTVYFSVPRGFAELIPLLRADAALRNNFFSRLQLFYYSGSALPPSVARDLDDIAVQETGERIPTMCGYGATETAPFAVAANWLGNDTGLAGLPVPGAELKLVRVGAKYEARLRGPMATPGYWRQSELTAALFDEDGYIRMGDALSFVEPGNIARGLAFDGRLAEDFKLTTGTWVGVGTLRARLIAEGHPLVQDVVLCGENRDAVTALIVPDLAACHALCRTSTRTASLKELTARPEVRAFTQRLLDRLAAAGTGSSTFVARAAILDEAPSAGAGELTDKGSVNQRAMLANRAALVAELYSVPPPPHVLVANASGTQSSV